MKKIFYSVVLLVVAVMMGACVEDSKLKMAVAEMNSRCPVDLGETGTLKAVELFDSTLVFRYVMTENVIYLLNSTPETQKFMAYSMLIGIKKTDENFLKLLNENKVNVKIVCSSESGSGELVSECSSEEIEALLNADQPEV